MSIQFNTEFELPKELVYQIFFDVNAGDLGRYFTVSKPWCSILSDDSLWNELFKRLIPLPRFELPININARVFISLCTITSKDQIVKRIQEYMLRVPINQKGRMTIFFPYNPGCLIEVKIETKNADKEINTSAKEEEITSNEICVFMGTLPNDLNYIQTSSYSDHWTTVALNLPQEDKSLSFSSFEAPIKNILCSPEYNRNRRFKKF